MISSLLEFRTVDKVLKLSDTELDASSFHVYSSLRYIIVILPYVTLNKLMS
jgi:hypothetical protein